MTRDRVVKVKEMYEAYEPSKERVGGFMTMVFWTKRADDTLISNGMNGTPFVCFVFFFVKKEIRKRTTER